MHKKHSNTTPYNTFLLFANLVPHLSHICLKSSLVSVLYSNLLYPFFQGIVMRTVPHIV